MRRWWFRCLAAPVALALLLQLPAVGAAAAGSGALSWSQPQQVLTLNAKPDTLSPLVADGGNDYLVAATGSTLTLLTDAGGTWEQYMTGVTDLIQSSEGTYSLAISGGIPYIAYIDQNRDLKLTYAPSGPANAWATTIVVPLSTSGLSCGIGDEAEAPAVAALGGLLAIAFDDAPPCQGSHSETNDVYVAAAPLSALAAGSGSPSWQVSEVTAASPNGGSFAAVAPDGGRLDVMYQEGGYGGAMGLATGTPGGAGGFTWSTPATVATVSNQGMDRPKMALAAANGVDVMALGAGGNVVDTWVASNAGGAWNAADLYRNNATGDERPTVAMGVCGPAVAYTQIPQQNASQAQVMVATLAGGQWGPQGVGAAEQSMDSMWPGIAATLNGFELVWVDDDSGAPVLYESSALCPPVVTGVSPASGPAAGGTAVTITGQALTGASAVDFGSGNAAAGVAVLSPTQITATAPAGTGTVDVTVTTPGGTSATSPADQFAYQTPASAPTASGTASPSAGTTASGSFSDLAGYDWAASAIAALARQGIVNGTGPGTFDPAGQVTRAQFAALMQRMFKLPAPATPMAFTDVPASFWGYAAVEAASPYFDYFQVPGGGFAFHPNDPFDRQDVATVIVRLLAKAGKLQVLSASDAQAVLARVTDASDIAPALVPYVATAIKAGIMAGFPDGSFQPQGLLNRAQVAVLLQRLENSFVTVGGS